MKTMTKIGENLFNSLIKQKEESTDTLYLRLFGRNFIFETDGTRYRYRGNYNPNLKKVL